MLKLLIALGLVAFATSVCVDYYGCQSYASRKDVYCKKSSMFRQYCKKLCGVCTDDGSSIGKCGIQKIPMSRVVGGKDAVPGSWPWQIAMYYKNSFQCGGTLVNNKWIVTAAHCTYGRATSSFKVVLGDHDRSKSNGNEQSFRLKRIINHPLYNKNRKLNNDIALMELERPAIFDDRVQPACLPTQGEKPAVGRKCFLTGFGRVINGGSSHPILQQLELTVQSNANCHTINKKYLPITNLMLCAANPKTSKNQAGCQGDSGGPLVCQQSDGSWKLQGAVSWGSPICNKRDAWTVFARVAEFRPWIDQYINN